MVCWELGLQLKRDWLPKLEKAGARLVAIGIGSADSACEFASRVGLPAEFVFADGEASAYKAVDMINTNFAEDGAQRGARMLSESTFKAIQKRANGRPWSFFGLFDIPFSATNDDLEKAKEIYKPLMPEGDDVMDKTMIQGGTLVFKGREQLFLHRDSSVGVHAELDKVLGAISA